MSIHQEFEDLQEVNMQREKRMLIYSKYVEEEMKKKTIELMKIMVEERKRKGLTQQDIADATGMKTPNVARLEACKTLPTLPVLMKYANAIGKEIEIKLL